MADGTTVRRLRGGACVLSRGSALHVLEGVSFSLLKGALGAWARGGAPEVVRRVEAAGHAAADGEQLAELFAELGGGGEAGEGGGARGGDAGGARGEAIGRVFSGADLARWIARRTGTPVVVAFRPPPDGVGADGAPRLLVGHAGWWVGPRAGACGECGRLAFAEAQYVAGETGEALDGAAHAAVLLSAETLDEMAAAVREIGGPGTAGWLRGGFGAAPVTPLSLRHPACGPCHPAAGSRRRVAPRLSLEPEVSAPAPTAPPSSPDAPSARAATAAARVLDRLQVYTEEVIEQPAGAVTWRNLPIVTVSWRHAYRDAAGDLAVHAGTQVGAGPTLAHRLLTARAEAVERFLVATRAPDLRGRPLAAVPGALDPREWGLFAPAQHAQRGFPFRAIAADTPLDWAHAYDLAARRWRLVPIDLVHGGSGAHLPASSTGAAAHTSVERVVTNGLLEILEREALQLAWYRGEPPAIVPRRGLRGEAAEQADWLRDRRWRVRLGHVRGRAGRHVVCAVGELSVDKPGLRAHGSVFTSAADGAFARATARALRELVTAVEALEAWAPPDAPPTDPRTALDAAYDDNDPAPIQRLYLDPAMRPALDAFLGGRPLGDPPPDRVDRAEALVAELADEGLRPVYVDCTVPGAAPFRAGKTILCGALPHSFAAGQLRLGEGPFAPPRRVRVPPPRGYRPEPGTTTDYPFPLG